MSDITDSDITKPTLRRLESNESVLVKTLRITINLLTNILMCSTVCVSLLYACNSTITAFQLHILLCVLGYQFLMCQGTLVLSRYNSWSMYLSRQSRKRLHVSFQVIGGLLVVIGSSVIMCEEQHHFNSAHGTLGIIALIVSLISILNGGLVNNAHKLSQTYMLLMKFIHYISGILTLFISAAALSTGFEEFPFRMWVNNDIAVAGLIFVTWLFSLLVALDFWLLSGQRLRNLVS